MSGPKKIRGNTEFRFRCFGCGRRYKIEKGYCCCRSTRGTVRVYLDLNAPISLYCRNCEPHHFHLNLDDEWRDYKDTNSEEDD